MFDNLHLTVLNSAIIYIVIIVAVRILGKKELGQLSVADLIFVMLVTNAVGDVMRASNDTLMGGLIAAVTLVVANKILNIAVYRSRKFSRIMEGSPSVVIRDGVPDLREMRRNRVSMAELEQAAREHGIGEISKIKLGILEKDGSISILDSGKVTTSEGILE